MDKPVTEEIREWQQLRVTRYMLQMIDRAISDTQEAWAAGEFTGETVDRTTQLNSGAIGFIRGMEELYASIENLHYDGDEDDTA